MTVKTLLICHDVVGEWMAGPGIRFHHLARVLSRRLEVTLAMPAHSVPGLEEPPYSTLTYQRRHWDSIKDAVDHAQVVILPSDIASDFPQLASVPAAVVIDGYDPLLAEWLALAPDGPEERTPLWRTRMSELDPQYTLGDFFICASERQRDWWIGLLEAHGRINPWTRQQDPSLRRLVDVVSFGLPETPPRPGTPVIKGVWPGVGAQDKVILWGGGLWPWLDPLTAIQAVARVCRAHPEVRLVFPGTRHPNEMLSTMPTGNDAAKELASRLGLLNRAVFFGDWVRHADWPQVLLESDIALTLHASETLEARLAFRSRVLDSIWAGLPTLATRGDVTSEMIAEYGLGHVVGCQDPEAVADAMLDLLNRPREEFRASFERARAQLTWERAAQPLVDFCLAPRRAADKAAWGNRVGNPHHLAQLDRLQEELDRRQAELDRQRQAMGAQQAEMGRRQEHILRQEEHIQQEEQANAKLRALVDTYGQRRAVRLANWLGGVARRLGRS